MNHLSFQLMPSENKGDQSNTKERKQLQHCSQPKLIQFSQSAIFLDYKPSQLSLILDQQIISQSTHDESVSKRMPLHINQISTKMHVRDMRQIFVSQDKYLIFDIQGGQQDILGLVVGLKLAHKHNRVVLGITCVAGRRSLDESARDALLAQQIAGTKLPVYKGSSQSMLLRKEYPNCINFSNKFQKLIDIPRDQALNELIQKQHASSFIHSSIKQYNQQLSFISFGPLTNLALAFHQTQCTGQQYQLSTIRVNGGSYDGVGNVVGSPSVEGNFGFDPQAAHIVITNYRNIYINPIERTLTTDLRRQLQAITQNTTENVPKILIDLVHQLLQHEYCINGPLLNVLGLFDKLITHKVMNVYSQIIRTGYGLAGMMVPNWLRLEVGENEQVPNTKIYRDVNRAVLCRLLKEAFNE